MASAIAWAKQRISIRFATLQLPSVVLSVVVLWMQSGSVAAVENTSGQYSHTLSCVVASGAILLGTMVCFAGYRLYLVSLFFSGCVVGGIFASTLVELAFNDDFWAWISFVGCGIVLGIVSLHYNRFGEFLVGAASGIMLAFTADVLFRAHSSHNLVLEILLPLLSIACGILAVKYRKPALIVATSLVGAEAVAWGVGYFSGDTQTEIDWRRRKSSDGELLVDHNYLISMANWRFLICILVWSVLGTVIQFYKTSKDISHDPCSKTENSRRSDLSLVSDVSDLSQISYVSEASMRSSSARTSTANRKSRSHHHHHHRQHHHHGGHPHLQRPIGLRHCDHSESGEVV